jgi:tetratricopeptide (TPR) repeat protein
MGRERTRTGKYIYFCAACLIFFWSGCSTMKKEFTWSSKQEVSPRKVQTQEELAKSTSEDLLRAKKLFDLGDYAGSLKENQKILSRSAKNGARDQALFNMGLIYAQVENPQRDFGKALYFLKTEIKEYPKSPLAGEAKLLVGILQEYEKLGQLVQKFKQENEELSQVIEKFKQVDIDVEEKKREKAR